MAATPNCPSPSTPRRRHWCTCRASCRRRPTPPPTKDRLVSSSVKPVAFLGISPFCRRRPARSGLPGLGGVDLGVLPSEPTTWPPHEWMNWLELTVRPRTALSWVTRQSTFWPWPLAQLSVSAAQFSGPCRRRCPCGSRAAARWYSAARVQHVAVGGALDRRGQQPGGVECQVAGERFEPAVGGELRGPGDVECHHVEFVIAPCSDCTRRSRASSVLAGQFDDLDLSSAWTCSTSRRSGG